MTLSDSNQIGYSFLEARVDVDRRGGTRRDLSESARVKFSGDKRIVVDGPFAETKELVAGFSIIHVKSEPEAPPTKSSKETHGNITDIKFW